MSSDGCVSVGEWFPVFESLAKKESVLTLSNSYRGIERFQDSRILEVNPDFAIVKVKDCKSYTMPGEQIQLHNTAFSRPVRATLQEMDYDCGLLFLSGFVYSDSEWKARYHERVQPKDPTYAFLSINRRGIRAFIENISLNGQGLLVDKRILADGCFKLGSKVALKFKLPPNYEWNGLKGSIINLKNINDSLVKLGLRLIPSVKESRSLIQYVTGRKQEILEELNQNCYEKTVARGIEALYF